MGGNGHSGMGSAAHIRGLVCMVISMLFTATKWSLIQVMVQRSAPNSALGKMSKLQLSAHVQPITGLVCCILAAFFESQKVCWNGLLAPELWQRLFSVALGITVITCSEMKLVQLTSAVACGVLINLHHIPMVFAGVLFFHDSLSVWRSIGFVCCIAGGFLYGAGRILEARANKVYPESSLDKTSVGN